MNKINKVFILFKTAFITSLTANSGYAILSQMKAIYVNKYKWFSNEKMSDYTALAQSCPGPMAISASAIVGYEVAGFVGALFTVLGCITPPIIIMIAVSFFYQYIIQNEIVAIFMKGMSFGVVAMLLDVLIGLFINITKKEIIYPVCLIVFSYVYIKFIDYSIFFLVLMCIACALIKTKLISKTLGDKKDAN